MRVFILAFCILLYYAEYCEGSCDKRWRFVCNNGMCISKAKRCNRIIDCRGGEDEANCDEDQLSHCGERNVEMAAKNNYTCRKDCSSEDARCAAAKKRCICDDECGLSCINKKAECTGEPPSVAHSIRTEVWKANGDQMEKIRKNEKYYHGYTASYVCELGRRLVGPIPRCTGKRTWSNEIPKCVDTVCRDPVPQMKNMILHSFMRNIGGVLKPFSAKTLPVIGSIVQYICQNHLQRIGTPPECGTNLKWTLSTVKCIVPCHAREEYPPLKCGTACETSSECPSGMECYCDGDCGRSCVNPNIDCGESPAVASASLSYIGEGVRKVARYACDVGYYRSSGQITRSCTGSSEWSGQPPVCKIVYCGDPTTSIKKTKGHISYYGGTEFDSTIEFSCRGNYKMYGAPVRTCMSNGRWSGKLTVCDKKDKKKRCPHPGYPVNGVLEGSDFSVNSTVTFKCDIGYVRYGPETRTCLWLLQWSEDQTPSCELPIYPHSTSDVVGTLRRSLSSLPDSKTSLGRSIDANSEQGQEIYFMFDISASVLKKKSDLKSEIEFAKRLVQRLEGFNGYVNYGIMVFASANVTALDITKSINSPPHTNETLERLDEIYENAVANDYQKEARSGTATAYALEQLKKMLAFIREQKNNKRHIFIFTDGEHTEGENPVNTRKKIEAEFAPNIEFYSITACTGCSPEAHQELLGLASKFENYVFIEDFYNLSGYLDQVTDLELNFTKCGKAGDVGSIKDQASLSLGRSIGGEDSKENAWPWQVQITKNAKTPREVLKIKNLVGGGSILNRQWILTAAHVLKNVDKSDGWMGSFVISVGVFERPDEEVGLRSTVQIYSFTEYIEHGQFNNTSYLNDIALIKLGPRYDNKMNLDKDNVDGMTYGYYVRPVCLPCEGTCITEDLLVDANAIPENPVMSFQEKCLIEENLLLKEDSKVVSTGFGHIEVVEDGFVRLRNIVPPKKLQQALLQIGNPATCKQGILDINEEAESDILQYSEKMICCVSGDPQKTIDTCKGDSGGPVVREVRNVKTGDTCWVQIGIVSFGWGCGMDFPGFYTNVAKFVEWIDNSMAPAHVPVPVPAE